MQHHPWASTFGSVIYHVTTQGELETLEPIFPVLNRLAKRGKLSYVSQVLGFLIVKGDGDPLEYRKLITRYFEPSVEEKVMTLAQ